MSGKHPTAAKPKQTRRAVSVGYTAEKAELRRRLAASKSKASGK